jgi:hypothetical protein
MKLAMKNAATSSRPDLNALAAAIACSPIVIAAPAIHIAALPPGFDDLDLAILRWIVAESRRLDANFAGH